MPDRCGVPEGRTDVASDPAFDISAVEFNESEERVECCVHEGGVIGMVQGSTGKMGVGEKVIWEGGAIGCKVSLKLRHQ